MKVLVNGNEIVAFGVKITLGNYEGESFKKWRIDTGEYIYYVVDDNATLIDGELTVPEDFETGKYLYENGELILNPNWKPFLSQEQRLLNAEEAIVTIENAMCETEIYSDERISAIEDALCELSTLLEI